MSCNLIQIVQAVRELVSSPQQPLSGQLRYLFHFNSASGTTNVTDEMGFAFVASSSSVIENNPAKFGPYSLRNKVILRRTIEAAEVVGKQDFCYEAWIRPTSFAGSANGLFAITRGSAASTGFSFYIKLDGSLALWVAGIRAQSAPGAVKLNQWQHIALSREGRFMRLFVDGKMVAVFENTQVSDFTDTGLNINNAAINDSGMSSGGITGVTDEIRFSVGTAVYTADFTPPTEPFPLVV